MEKLSLVCIKRSVKRPALLTTYSDYFQYFGSFCFLVFSLHLPSTQSQIIDKFDKCHSIITVINDIYDTLTFTE